jgi:hypothetical protein
VLGEGELERGVVLLQPLRGDGKESEFPLADQSALLEAIRGLLGV